MSKIFVYDVTLREGMQSAGASFTLADKVRMAKILDSLGVDFIEGGNPSSNPKDDEFFRVISESGLKNSKICAFGSTCRTDLKPEEDKNLEALANTFTDYVCIYGKTSVLHVNDVLKTTKENNLRVISDSVSYLVKCGKKVIFDAEHFFDGYQEDPSYAFACINAAKDAGAFMITLCDTNGGTLPHETGRIFSQTIAAFPGVAFAVHCHNDNGCGDANTIECARLGASCVQVSLHGFGERCGNANLFTVIPTLQLKMGYDCLPDLTLFKDSSFMSADILNIKVNPKSPYVGKDAFRHKAGAHIDAVRKNPSSFEHVDPAAIGAHRHFIVSEVSGKAAVTAKINNLMPEYSIADGDAEKVCEAMKKMEFKGYQFENADASFEMLVRRTLNLFTPHFVLNNYKVVAFSGESSNVETASAIVDMVVNGQQEITADKGIGPVDALDRALRKALGRFYPEIASMHLNDYRVRVLDTKQTTASMVRVLIESTDGIHTWNTIGVSGDIIEASWIALVDAHEYMLLKVEKNK